MRNLLTTALLGLFTVCTMAVSAQQSDSGAGGGSNSANNPVEPRLTLQYWNYYSPSLAYSDKQAENGIGRTLIPFQIAGVQQIMHVNPTIASDPTASSGPRTGLSGTQLYNFTLGKFDLGLPQKVILGFGPLAIIPTRSNRNAGTDKWQAGVGGVVLAPQDWGIAGVLATWQHTLAGPVSKVTSIQPQIFYNLPLGFYLRSSAAITFNGASQTAVVPIGLGLGKVFNLDAGYTLNVYSEGQPSVYRTGIGAPNYQIFTGFSLQLPASYNSSWHIF
jgi:hypothetical protein